jgi:FkbM family methyltransferase
MLGYVTRRIQRHRSKRTFREYGWEVRRFVLEREGAVEYAQWLHPFEKPKTIAQADVDGWRCFLGAGDFAVDVGAHTGDTTVPMALACGPDGLVLALEPNPHVFRVLEANARLNPGMARIAPENFAATAGDGEFVFHYWDASFGNGGYLSRLHNQRHGHRYPLRVQGRNLERFLRERHAARLPRLRLIKTDAEGYDRDVIASLRGVVKEFRPVVVCEVHRKLDDGERRALHDALALDAYVLRRYLGGARPLGEPVGAGDMRRWPHFDLAAIPRGHAALGA